MIQDTKDRYTAKKSIFYLLISLIMLMMNGCFHFWNERRNQKTTKLERKVWKFQKHSVPSYQEMP